MPRTGPNLYEILRAASGGPAGAKADSDPGPVAVATPPPAPAPASTPRPKEKNPSPPKAAAPAPAETDSRIQTEVLPARQHVATPPSAPPPRLTPALTPMVVAGPKSETPRPAAAPADPGERAIRLTTNAVVGAAIVLLGLLVLAYMMGVRSGRGPVSPGSAGGSGAASGTPAKKKWTLQAIEYKTRTAQDRTAAMALTGQYKKELERLGWKNIRVATLGSDPDQRMILLVGEYDDPESPDSKKALADLRQLKIGRDQREPNFGRTALFVAAQ